MATKVDLSQLAFERADSTARSIVRKRPWIARWLIPAVIICGFVGVVAWSARDQFLSARSVTVTPVMLSRAEVQVAGTPLFQAAGWVEPRPTPLMVSAMVEGVVEKLFVVDGQAVAAGESLAQLYDADSRLALQEAEAARELQRAELEIAQASLKAAQRNLEQPVHLIVAHAEAEAELAKLATEIKNLPFALRTAEARLLLARQDLTGKQSVAEALSARTIQRAQNEFDAAAALVEELSARGPSLDAELQAWQRKCDALHSKLKLKTEEVRALESAAANVAAAQARLAQADTAIEIARLNLTRMNIRAPISGRVLSLHAQPGQRLMGINAASEQDASAVASLYDPQQLQVRADVRLEDVAQVQLGQPVQVTTAAFAAPLNGRVLSLTSSADIQKNTLQVKVSIDDPPSVLKPEMLAQVVFQAPPSTVRESEDSPDTLRLLVPRELVEKTAEGGMVWVADAAAGVAVRRTVQLGQAGTEQLVEVTQGLTALDKLIVTGREGLADGDRITISGDDQKLGIASGARSVSEVSATADDSSRAQ